jgi:VWFA-related protein
VVTGRGQPVRGLGPADFRLDVDGHAVTVESAQWVEGERPYADGLTPEAAAAAGAEAAPEGRLIVFFFQKDIAAMRTLGLLRMQREALKLARQLEPQDRVAVVSFDSHFKVWLDFTRDRAALGRILEHGLIFEDRPHPVQEPYPSLLAHVDPEAARRASSPETALLLLGEALGALPGSKSVAFFGWGLGRLVVGIGVVAEPDYGPAVEALHAARATVFALDVTNADRHTLEVGLQSVAEHTGGFYSRTHDFPTAAIQRLAGALSGHYVLAFERPDLKPGTYSLRVRLAPGHKGDVLARNTYLAE